MVKGSYLNPRKGRTVQLLEQEVRTGEKLYRDATVSAKKANEWLQACARKYFDAKVALKDLQSTQK